MRKLKAILKVKLQVTLLAALLLLIASCDHSDGLGGYDPINPENGSETEIEVNTNTGEDQTETEVMTVDEPVLDEEDPTNPEPEDDEDDPIIDDPIEEEEPDVNDIIDFQGEGTIENPYLIVTADDLRELAIRVSTDTTFTHAYFHYRLAGNINLQNIEFTPIGTNDKRFFGTFDGNGFTISGLNITEGNLYNGLFAVIGAGGKIFNLGVSGTVTGGDYTGGIAGGSFGTIENCYSSVTISGRVDAGGIVGHNRTGGKVIRCYSTGNITGTGTTLGAGNAGGIVGYNSYSVSYCVSLVSTVDGITSGRVIGTDRQTSSGNKALFNILVNGKLIGEDADTKTHGTAVTYGTPYSTVFNTWSTEIWHIPDGELSENGQLPIFK